MASLIIIRQPPLSSWEMTAPPSLPSTRTQR